jgi:hypothetical protein
MLMAMIAKMTNPRLDYMGLVADWTLVEEGSGEGGAELFVLVLAGSICG